jgi:hypothetical protein
MPKRKAAPFQNGLVLKKLFSAKKSAPDYSSGARLLRATCGRAYSLVSTAP